MARDQPGQASRVGVDGACGAHAVENDLLPVAVLMIGGDILRAAQVVSIAVALNDGSPAAVDFDFSTASGTHTFTTTDSTVLNVAVAGQNEYIFLAADSGRTLVDGESAAYDSNGWIPITALQPVHEYVVNDVAEKS